ncbi:glycosyltransferase family 39 protein [bacterium]|nr:glycosyltransferase family 39 protein [bacterium]
MLKKYSSVIVALILIAFFAVSLIVSLQESTTMDEKAHIPSAYSYVKYNDMRLNPEHPPLLKDLAGLPLLFFNPRFPADDPLWTEGVNEQWELGDKFIHSNDADQITFWSRLPITLIALLLGFFIFKWTKELAGAAAGIFALILYAFDPNILGHSHYVTTDIGIAAFIFISFYYFIKFLKYPSWKNTILAGIFLGLAELAKFSSVILFPFFGLILVIYALAKRSKPPKTPLGNLSEYMGKYVLIVFICFAVIWILYFYNTFNMPAEKIQDIANTVFGNEGMGELAKSTVIGMSTMPVLKYLSEYFLGVFMVFTRVAGGNTYYFLGTVSNHATPFYFPVVFLLKETLPFLFLILAASVYAFAEMIKKALSARLKENWKKFLGYLQSGVAQYSMLGFIIFYSFLSITGNLNIGFRHLFPILPFVYVLVAKKVTDFIKSCEGKKIKTTVKATLAILVAWIILEPIIFFPSYLSYFNELAGGPKNGYKYVTDSNYDWGQDLKRLSRWVDKYNSCALSKNPEVCIDPNRAIPIKPNQPIKKIRVDYFGGSNPEYYLKDKFIPWHSYNNPEPGWYAISIGFLQESIHKEKQPGEKSYEWLRGYQPITKAGDSIFVYYVE